MELLIIFAAVCVLGILAARYGYDSRDGFRGFYESDHHAWHVRRHLSSLGAFGLAVLLSIGPLVQPAAAQSAAPTPTPQPGQVPITNPITLTAPTPTPTVVSSTVVTQGGLVPVPVGTPSIAGGIPLPPTPGLVQVSSCGGAGRIFQNCPIDGPTEVRLETQAITTVMQEHGLPASDQGRTLGWARNDIRGVLFTNLVAAFQKNPSARTADEALAISKVSQAVRQARVQAASVARDEYNRWANDPCGYVAPPGFSFDRSAACASSLGQAFGGPNPPSRADFQAYGAAAAYGVYQSDAALKAISGETAKTIGTEVGLSAAVPLTGVAAAVGASVATATLAAVQPFLAGSILYGGGATVATLGGTAEAAAAEAAIAAESAGEAGAISVAGPIAIITLALVAGVIQGINVFTAADLPSQLASDLNTAQNYDVASSINSSDVGTSTAGKQEVYATFLEMTLPDFPSTDAVPAAQSSDPRLEIVSSSASPQSAASIQYTAWDGSHHAGRMSSGWWVDSDASGHSKLTLGIDYLDPAGARWTASRAGHLLVPSRVDSPSSAHLASAITYQNWAAHATTASLAVPPSAWIIGGSASNIGGNTIAHFNASGALDKVDGARWRWLLVQMANPGSSISKAPFSVARLARQAT